MKNVLLICSRNQWQNPAAEKVYSKDPRVHVRSASTSLKARHTVNTKKSSYLIYLMSMGI